MLIGWLVLLCASHVEIYTCCCYLFMPPPRPLFATCVSFNVLAVWFISMVCKYKITQCVSEYYSFVKGTAHVFDLELSCKIILLGFDSQFLFNVSKSAEEPSANTLYFAKNPNISSREFLQLKRPGPVSPLSGRY